VSETPAVARSIHFAGSVVRFVARETRILDALDAHLNHCRGEEGQTVATYEIAAVDQATFSVTVNGGSLYSGIKAETLLPLLMRDGLAQLNGAAVSSLVFHAAAVSDRGRALILCGPGGSGKSSLAAWLTASGFQYLTDEVIALPLEGGDIRGFCRSLILKRGSEFIWRRWLANEHAQGFLRFADGSAWIAPTLLNPNAVCRSAVSHIMLFPKYIPESSLNIQRLTQADTLFRLLQCLVNARNFPDGGLPAAARLAKQVQAYSLTYSNIESAVEWIQQIVRTA
jgi:hypothetical protein